MEVKTIKTHKILPFRETIYGILDRYLHSMRDKSVLVVTSKIVAICEGNVVKSRDAVKSDLIKNEAELYLPPQKNKS